MFFCCIFLYKKHRKRLKLKTAQSAIRNNLHKNGTKGCFLKSYSFYVNVRINNIFDSKSYFFLTSNYSSVKNQNRFCIPLFKPFACQISHDPIQVYFYFYFTRMRRHMVSLFILTETHQVPFYFLSALLFVSSHSFLSWF